MLKKLGVAMTAATLFTGVLTGCSANEDSQAKEQSKVKETSKEVNVYTARHYESDDEVFKDFTEQTGIKVNVLKGEAEALIERLKREGENTKADLFITVDGGVLNVAKEADILQPVKSELIEEQVPAQYQDAQDYWVGLTKRARVITYAKDRVKPEDLSTYEDLTTDKWKGKILVRTSENLYNQSLLASFVALNGKEKATEWAQGMVDNFARTPEGNDRDQAKAMIAGTGDVAIMNTYYVGLLMNSQDPKEAEVGKNMGVFFPNQETNGTHVNISGVGLTKNAKNKDNAVALMEYMTGKEAQETISSMTYEFPVNPDAALPALLKEWGTFKEQQLPFADLGKFNKDALEIFNTVGWK